MRDESSKASIKTKQEKPTVPGRAIRAPKNNVEHPQTTENSSPALTRPPQKIPIHNNNKKRLCVKVTSPFEGGGCRFSSSSGSGYRGQRQTPTSFGSYLTRSLGLRGKEGCNASGAGGGVPRAKQSQTNSPTARSTKCRRRATFTTLQHHGTQPGMDNPPRSI